MIKPEGNNATLQVGITNFTVASVNGKKPRMSSTICNQEASLFSGSTQKTCSTFRIDS
jgi:hypothetical protein